MNLNQRSFFSFCGINLNKTSFSQAIALITQDANSLDTSLGGKVVVTPNADHVLRFQHDAQLKHCYEKSDYVFADGMPLVWASRLLKDPLPERVTGADLLPAVCGQAAKHNLRVLFFGAPPGHAEKAAEALRLRFPGLQASWICPKYGFEKSPTLDRQYVQQIAALAPDFLFVGLGSPKQEIWVEKHRNDLNSKVILNVGAAISFAAGLIPRAPLWMQRSGLEWLYRMLSEPKRLIPRYAKNFAFFALILSEFKYRKCAASPKGLAEGKGTKEMKNHV